VRATKMDLPTVADRLSRTRKLKTDYQGRLCFDRKPVNWIVCETGPDGIVIANTDTRIAYRVHNNAWKQIPLNTPDGLYPIEDIEPEPMTRAQRAEARFEAKRG
jgi:hypothetical protein